MVGLPLAWEEEVPSLDGLPASCPYSWEEIREYLENEHHKWVLDESPTTFSVKEVVAERRDGERHYWLVEAVDGLDRRWNVLVGAGKSPFNPGKKMRRWMIASENILDGTPTQYLDEQVKEQNDHDRGST